MCPMSRKRRCNPSSAAQRSCWKRGSAKPEDRPRFLSRIHQEAERSVALINDIIRLSQLDEGGQLCLRSWWIFRIWRWKQSVP